MRHDEFINLKNRIAELDEQAFLQQPPLPDLASCQQNRQQAPTKKRRPIKVVPTSDKHERNIKLLTSKFLRKMQFPKPNKNDVQIAINRAKQIQKRTDLDMG
jgi:hypothetical protein